ncbi:MAG: hypothetical protein WBL25_13755 [Anaerolineales bacterium]
MTSHRIDRTERILLTLWFISNLCVGLFLVRDMGMSYDEPNYYLYAQNTVDAYRSFFGLAYTPVFGPDDLPNYGPAFIIFPELVTRLLELLSLNIFVADIWHFSYFIIFQLGGLCLYLLARRWYSLWAAWGVLLLYTFQPVLWGHGFMNPKDIPFMAFYLFTLWSGLSMADSFGAREADSLSSPRLEQKWMSIIAEKHPQSIKLFKVETYTFFIFLCIAALTFPLRTLVAKFVTFLYTADPGSSAGRWFSSIAPQAASVPVEKYISRAQSLLSWIEFIPLFMIAFVLVIHFITISLRTKNTTAQKPIEEDHRDQSHRFKRADLYAAFRSPKVVFAGLLLGLTISIRVLGPWPGIIVIFYLALTLRWRALSVIVPYLFYAGIATFFTWPNLWPDPVGRLIDSLLLMSNFPWPGRTLFNGRLYEPDGHPISYLPVLLNIQLTEVLVVLIYLGTFLLFWLLIRKRLKLDLQLVLVMGAILPLIGLIASNATMYDNFRQVLFIIPPLILIAGLALDMIFSVTKPIAIRILMLIALAFPGIYAGVQLHPYEYIYYNSFVGGVQGASGNYELDYWRTVFSEMTLHLNEVAAPDSKVVVGGFNKTVFPYARSDILVHKNGENAELMRGGYDYAILSTHHNADRLYPDAKIIFSVERDGITLGVIKAVKGMAPR